MPFTPVPRLVARRDTCPKRQSHSLRFLYSSERGWQSASHAPKRARPAKISVLVAACSVETVAGPLLICNRRRRRCYCCYSRHHRCCCYCCSHRCRLLLSVQSSSSLLLLVLQSSTPLLLSLQSSSPLLLSLLSSSSPLLLNHCREDVMVLVHAGSFEAVVVLVKDVDVEDGAQGTSSLAARKSSASLHSRPPHWRTRAAFVTSGDACS